jgi:hypothetical protein
LLLHRSAKAAQLLGIRAVHAHFSSSSGARLLVT